MDQIPVTAQHYIECDTESCSNFSQFYCNTCHQRTCDLCRESHLKQKIGHVIVLYQERKRRVPSEKCRIHLTEDISFYCDDCKAPVCYTCLALDHSDHADIDLETIYNDILQQCQKKLIYIWKTFIPKAEDDVKSLGEKGEYIKKEIAELRLSMAKRADELKETVDIILTDHIKKLDDIENSILDDLKEQQKNTEDYINYLKKMNTDYESKMPSIKPTELVKSYEDVLLATLKKPKQSNLKLPMFTPGKLNKDKLATQFGEIEINSKCSFSITKLDEKTISGIQYGISHISPLPSNKLWVSVGFANLFQIDMKGNILQKIFPKTKHILGSHTVTQEEELLYTDIERRVIYRVTSDMSTNTLISTGDWEPGAIYSSHINGHILLAMNRENTMKVARYTRGGRKLQDIQWNNEGQPLYHNIFYITENINGDICTSDKWESNVVVVTRSGEHRFSYTGHQSQSGFYPYGICTDVLGHILVCNGYEGSYNLCSSVHMLDMDGQFLFFLLTPDQCPQYPFGLCIDNQHNLLIGSFDSSTVSVYKYLQNTKI